MLTTLNDYINEKKNINLAPNGKPSNLSNEMYNFVRTDEFIDWFGDWLNNPELSSKIIDDNAEPLLVYHGTNIRFCNFELDKQKNGWLGKGFYFTNNKNSSKEYGKIKMKVFLNIRNPFIVKGSDPSAVNCEIMKKCNTEIDMNIYIELNKNGYDGIIFNHWDKGNMISCFIPEQIKIIN